MTAALIIFIVLYVLMFAFQKYRPYIALGGGAVFIILGLCGLYDFTPIDALLCVDYNVLLMIGGTMGIVTLFIDSKMPHAFPRCLFPRYPM